MNPKWLKRFALLRVLLWVMVPGALLGVAALLIPQNYRPWPVGVAILLFLPGAIYIYLVSIWHWKDRYRGKHSDLWGALLIIETSGWFKLVYLFRHLLPDMRQRGRYQANEPAPEVS